MVRIYNSNIMKNTRLYLTYSLVFFLWMMLATCKHHSNKITLVWKDGRAVGIQIPKHFTGDVSAIGVKHTVRIVLAAGSGRKGILGDFEIDGDNVTFQPLIPLSPGLGYDILKGDRLIGHILVPVNNGEPPALISVYPEADTLPENLLKFYLRFSKPMRTGQSLDYICLLDKHKDTMRNVFLNLQPELWDTSGTVLTIWLDPGRIKRDLVLNRKLGNPLVKSETYQLIISRRWKDNRGVSLSKNYVKQFVTANRDGHVPDINSWQLTTPRAGTKAPLIINTREPLDHYLLQESVGVINNAETTVDGTIEVNTKDRVWKFTPSSLWTARPYKLRVKARLEDLAGNNLNRVFDRDITKDKQRNKEYYERVFVVKH